MIRRPYTRRAWLAALAGALGAGAAHAGGKRGKKVYQITFHVQGSPVEAGLETVENLVGNQVYYFRRKPDLTDKNFRAFQPFPSPVGQGWGATFLLDGTGQKLMYMLGEMNEGALLKAMVNGTPVDFSVIDRVGHPRTLTIWRGLKPELIEMIGKRLDLIHPNPNQPQKKKWLSRKSASDRRSTREVQELPLPSGISEDVPYNPY